MYGYIYIFKKYLDIGYPYFQACDYLSIYKYELDIGSEISLINIDKYSCMNKYVCACMNVASSVT